MLYFLAGVILLTLAAAATIGIGSLIRRRPDPVTATRPPPTDRALTSPAGIGHVVQTWHRDIAEYDGIPQRRGDTPTPRRTDPGWVPTSAFPTYRDAEKHLRDLIGQGADPRQIRVVSGYATSVIPVTGGPHSAPEDAPDDPAGPDEPAPTPGGTLYDRLGAAEGLKATVKTFYSRVVADQDLRGKFAVDEAHLSQLMRHQVAIWTTITDGPNPDGLAGRSLHSWVARAHEGMGLSGDDFNAMGRHLRAAAAAAGIAEADLDAIDVALEDFRPDVVRPGWPGGGQVTPPTPLYTP